MIYLIFNFCFPIKKFNAIGANTYFTCISYAYLTEEERRNYTKQVFDFYDKFLPGVKIYKEGFVPVHQLIKVIKSDKCEKWLICKPEKCTNCAYELTEIQRKKNERNLVDFYGKL